MNVIKMSYIYIKDDCFIVTFDPKYKFLFSSRSDKNTL